MVALAGRVVGTAVVGSAVSVLGVGSAAPDGDVGRLGDTPTGDAGPLPGAAATCPGLPWTVLAAIGTVESDNGQSTLPGVHSGANSAGAKGPMQFEPATFAEYDEPVPPDGADPPSPYDPVDAVYAAARLLCANGASGGTDIAGAVEAYNHSASYVAQVLALAQSYVGTSAGSSAGTPVSDAGAVAVEWALAQIGTPYVWGGESPGIGFDCSGLVQAAYKVAGVALPRIAQDQYDDTPKLAPGVPLAPGDLVFFGGGPTSIDHVGLFVGIVSGDEVMVDAPDTGADVRAEAFPATVGARSGTWCSWARRGPEIRPRLCQALRSDSPVWPAWHLAERPRPATEASPPPHGFSLGTGPNTSSPPSTTSIVPRCYRKTMRLRDADYEDLLTLRTGLRRFLRWSEQQAEEAGLTPAQHQLLLAIRGHSDRRGPTVGEVADYLLLRHHSAVGLVDRAVSAGLVQRIRDPEDHRIVRLQLTTEGRKSLEALSAQHLEELQRLAQRLPTAWRGLMPRQPLHGIDSRP